MAGLMKHPPDWESRDDHGFLKFQGKARPVAPDVEDLLLGPKGRDPRSSSGEGLSRDEFEQFRSVKPGSGGTAKATKDQQASYDKFVSNGMRVIYDKKAMPQIVKSIAAEGDVVQGLANTLFSVVSRLAGSAQKSGVDLEDDVVTQGASELLEQLADLAKEAGVHEFTPDELVSALNAFEARVGALGGGAQPMTPGAQAQPMDQPSGDVAPRRGLMA